MYGDTLVTGALSLLLLFYLERSWNWEQGARDIFNLISPFNIDKCIPSIYKQNVHGQVWNILLRLLEVNFRMVFLCLFLLQRFCSNSWLSCRNHWKQWSFVFWISPQGSTLYTVVLSAENSSAFFAKYNR